MESNSELLPPASASMSAGSAGASDETEYSWLKFLYKNKIHDDYVYDMLWTVLIIFLYCCAYAYLKIRANAQVISNNWIQYRCNPAYMPFAGMIMQPNDAFGDQIKYANINFEYCTQKVLKGISSGFINPIYYMQSIATSILHGIVKTLNDMRTLINNIRNAVSSVMADVMGRILNVMQPVVMMIISARDMMGKIQGIMTAALYTLYGTYATILSGLRSIFEIIVIILIAMAAAIVALWIAVGIAAAFGPFGVVPMMISTAAATVLTGIFIGIAIPMGIIAHFLAETVHISGLSGIPSL